MQKIKLIPSNLEANLHTDSLTANMSSLACLTKNVIPGIILLLANSEEKNN